MILSPLGNSAWRAPRARFNAGGAGGHHPAPPARLPILARGGSTAAPDTATTAAMYLFRSFREPSARGRSSIRRLLIMRTLITRAAGLTRADRLLADGQQMVGSDDLSTSIVD